MLRLLRRLLCCCDAVLGCHSCVLLRPACEQDKRATAMTIFSFSAGPGATPIAFVGRTDVRVHARLPAPPQASRARRGSSFHRGVPPRSGGIPSSSPRVLPKRTQRWTRR